MRKFLFVILLLFHYTAAYAEVVGVDSLEWMTVDAPLIVRGKVAGCQATAGPHAVIYRDITIRIREVLKGDVSGDTLKVRLRTFKGNHQGIAWKKSGHSFLFFLRRGRAQDDKALAGWWVLRERHQSVIDLEQPQRVYKADMKCAKDATDILGIVRDWATWKKESPQVGAPNIFKPQTGFLRLELKPDAEFYYEVYAGSTCYINVPAEEKYRSLALSKARSQNVSERREGAEILRNYPGSETIRILRLLLYDDAEQGSLVPPDELVGIWHPVRSAAYESLLALGQEPRKPTLERFPTPQEIQNARYCYWERAVWQLLPEAWIVSSIEDVNEPQGWTRIAGGKGTAIECAYLKTNTADDKRYDHCVFTLYVMPGDWEGKNKIHPKENLTDGTYVPALDRPSIGTTSGAIYLGHNSDRHFFCRIRDLCYWPNAYEQIRRYFPLKINKSMQLRKHQ